MSSEAELAWGAIYRAHTRLAPRIDKELKQSIGLTYSEYEALSELQAAGGPVRMADLASRVAVTRTHASRLVGALKLAGLVNREVNPDDGRSQLAWITDDGARRLQESSAAVKSALAQSIGGQVSVDELRQLAALLDKAVAYEA